MTTLREPAEIWPLGSFVRDELLERGWSRDDLLAAMSMGGSPLVTKKCLEAVLSVSPDTIEMGNWVYRKLAQTLGGSEAFFRNLDTMFWEALASGHYHLVKDTGSAEGQS